MKREKPYEVKQGEDGLFVASGEEPIDSPNVQLRMPMSMYNKLNEVALKNRAEWIRQAIAEKLERESK
jgi:hypothetical protein